MDVQLRKSHFNALVAKFFFYFKANGRGCGAAHVIVTYPETQAEIKGAGPKILKRYTGRGIFEHIAVSVGRCQQNAHDSGRIAAIGHADIDFAAHGAAVARPVDEAACHKFRVGHDDKGIVERFHHGGAHADLAHTALGSAHFNNVSGLQGAAEDKDEAGKEVVDDGLHAKTDTHGKTASYHGQVAQFHAQGFEGEKAEKTPQGIGKGRLYGRNERGVYLQALLGQAPKKARAHGHGCACNVKGADNHEQVQHVELRSPHVDPAQDIVMQQGQTAGQGSHPLSHAHKGHHQHNGGCQGYGRMRQRRPHTFLGQFFADCGHEAHAAQRKLQCQRAGDKAEIQHHAV